MNSFGLVQCSLSLKSDVYVKVVPTILILDFSGTVFIGEDLIYCMVLSLEIIHITSNIKQCQKAKTEI